MPLRLLPALLACALAACSRPGEAEAVPVPPQIQLQGVRIRSYQGERLVAQSQAARLAFERGSTDFSAHQAQVRFSSQGRLGGRAGAVELRAVRVEGNLGARTAEGREGVTLLTGSGLRGETLRARFDLAAQEARGAEPISIQGPGYASRAAGFRLLLAEEQLELEGEVESRLGAAP